MWEVDLRPSESALLSQRGLTRQTGGGIISSYRTCVFPLRAHGLVMWKEMTVPTRNDNTDGAWKPQDVTANITF